MAGKKGRSGRPRLTDCEESVNINVRIPKTLQEKLMASAKKHNVSMAQVARELLNPPKNSSEKLPSQMKASNQTNTIPSENLFEYAICGNGAVLTGLSDEVELPRGKTLSIPPTLGGLPVVAIREVAFSRCKYLSDVAIPNTVISIGDGAFAGSFITSLHIPASVASIGKEAFVDTYDLRSIEVDPSNPFYSTINGCLVECGGIDLLRFSSKEQGASFIIPKGVHFIRSRAFSCCDVSSIAMEEVVRIEKAAFLHCSHLTSVKLSDDLMSIGDLAFWGCSKLAQIEIPQSVHEMGRNVFRDCSPDFVLTVTEGSYAEQWAKENGIAYKTL